MNDKQEENSEELDSGKLALDLNFSPSWARADPGANLQRYRDYDFDQEDAGASRGRDGRRECRPRRDFDRDSGDRRRQNRDRPPRSSRRDFDHREDRRDQSQRPFHGSFSDQHNGSADRPFHRAQGDHPQGDRPPRRNFDRRQRPERPQLPIEIRVLPEQKALGAVIRRIQTSYLAYPLRDIASLFLDNPASCLLRLEPQKDQREIEQLYQCKVCGMPALSEDEIRKHLISQHLEEFFDVEEVDCEPPSGSFVCVARCGLSGELLGPPNHHSYKARIHEMLRTRYPNMSEEEYCGRIETVRDPEVIEQWRQMCTKKKIYRRKVAAAPAEAEAPVEDAPKAEGTDPAPEAAPAEAAAPETPAGEPIRQPPMEREVAEIVFVQEILPTLIANVKHLVCPASIALHTPDRPLMYQMKDVLYKERRFPTWLFFALRGAFRHRKLNLFRANDPKGPDFVMLRTPAELDAEHAVKELKDVLAFVTEHPGCTKSEMIAALAPEGEEAKVRELLVQLAWLTEKGHVIHYYNDVLSAPMDYPPFHFLPSEKAAHRDGQKKNPMVDAVNEDKKTAAEAGSAAERPAAQPVAEAGPVAEKPEASAEKKTTEEAPPAPVGEAPETPTPEAKEESPSAE